MKGSSADTRQGPLGAGCASERGHYRAFQLLLLAVATWGVTYARFTLGPLQESIRGSLGLTDNQIAWLQGPAVAVPMALAAIPLGLFVDRRRRAILFVPFAALSFVGAALASVTSSPYFIAATRGITGLALAAILVAAYSMVADLYPPAARGRANTLVAMGEIAGSPAAFALGGFLLALAPSQSSLPWQWALLRMSAPLLLVVILMSFLREPARGGMKGEGASLRGVWLHLWQYRRVIGPLLFGRMTVWIADGAVLVWAAPIFSRHFHLPPDRVGALIGISLFISGVCGPLMGGTLADLCERFGGPRRTMSALSAVALCSVPAAMFANVSSPIVSCVMLTCFLTSGYVVGTAAISLATIVVPGELRGLYLAVTISVCALLFIGVAPLLVSLLAGALGGRDALGHALTAVAAGTSLLGFAVFACARKYFPLASTRLELAGSTQ